MSNVYIAKQVVWDSDDDAKSVGLVVKVVFLIILGRGRVGGEWTRKEFRWAKGIS